MKILHINVSSICDKFYLGFYVLLKRKGINQSVFTPYREKSYSVKEKQAVTEEYAKEEVELNMLPIKTLSDRVLFNKKITKYVNALHCVYRDMDFDVIHAHSLYSDGAVAYDLYKRYSIPYVVAVRSTDTDFFMKYFKSLSVKARDILCNAQNIIFISPDLKKKTIFYLYERESNVDWINNCEVIPNGVNDFWLENIYKSRKLVHKNQVKILQVSRLNKGKNIDKSVLAVKELLKRGINVSFVIAGDGGQREKLIKLIKRNDLEKNVKLLGFISDRQEMLRLYRKCDIFLMPSEGETFGISYIEALTQGLPVIGLKDTGVSGYFINKEVGIFLETASSVLIADAIQRIIDNYTTMSKNTIRQIEQFNWKQIINKYINIYENSLINK